MPTYISSDNDPHIIKGRPFGVGFECSLISYKKGTPSGLALNITAHLVKAACEHASAHSSESIFGCLRFPY
jgi:hypothetical protein